MKRIVSRSTTALMTGNVDGQLPELLLGPMPLSPN